MPRSFMPPASEPESMEQLRGDCARMAPHWRTDDTSPTVAPSVTATAPSVPHIPQKSPVPEPGATHRLRIPASYARLLDGMSDYGD